MSVLLLLFCVADHVSYVSFGFGATSFQLVVKILIYLFHLTSFFSWKLEVSQYRSSFSRPFFKTGYSLLF